MLKFLNLTFRVRHYEDRSATLIAIITSDELHSRLKNDIRNIEHGAFSIIIDTSTNNALKQYAIVYFRISKENTPNVLFYKSIPIGAKIMKTYIIF